MTKNMTMTELITLIHKSAERIGKYLVESRLAEDPRTNPEEPVCRQCLHRLRIQEPAQQRAIQTALGKIEYKRAYGVCDRCGHTGAPLDEALGIPTFGPSIDARQKICHAAVVGRSFEDGREILHEHARIEISAKHVRSIAEKEGALVVRERVQDVAAYTAGTLTMTCTDKPALCVVSADGGRVQTRESVVPGERWKEDKIGVVYDACAKPHAHAPVGAYDGAEAKTKTYVATMESWESLGWMLRIEAERRGWLTASSKVFIADGAKHIRELQKFQFPDATFILDWAHAAQHISDCAKAAYGEGTRQAIQWYEKHKQMLWDGLVDDLIAAVRRLSARIGLPKKNESELSPRRILYQNANSYFPNNKDAITYPQFRAQGWPIGSGVAEGAIKQFALRLKGTEKFWNISHTGAEEMLALCALYHSEDGRWDRHWLRRAQPR